MLNHSVQSDRDLLGARFRDAEPFRHIVIDDFFSSDFCADLLDDFPPFARGNARNEDGGVGLKSTLEKIRSISPAYTQLDDLIQTREFLDVIGKITGIENLLYDPWYFGGGTHENRTGQDLDPHIDFNRHPVERWHRRLNLIIYLNREWDESWGGCLELHSDPRATDDRVKLVAPMYNRAVIFETTELSWHGFSRISLPDDKQSLSRKSIALYFYTTDRPQHELADTHSTIYVERPLPDRFKAGLTLTGADVQELSNLLNRRDQHNQRLYRETIALGKQLEQTQAALHSGFLGRLHHFARRVLARMQR